MDAFLGFLGNIAIIAGVTYTLYYVSYFMTEAAMALLSSMYNDQEEETIKIEEDDLL